MSQNEDTSTSKISALLNHYGLLNNKPKLTQTFVEDNVATKLSTLSKKAEEVENVNPSKPNQEAVQQLANLRDILTTCLQPQNPNNIFNSN